MKKKNTSQLFIPVRNRASVKPRRGSFDHKKFYRNRKDAINLSVWMSFEERILKAAKSLDFQEAISFQPYDLKHDAADSKVMTGLAIKPMTLNEALWAMAVLLMRQAKGESGDLLSNHSANIFYVEAGGFVFALRLHWYAKGSEWFVSDWKIGECTSWPAGSRIFVRN